MKTINLYIYLILISFVIGFSIFITSVEFFVKDIGLYNKIDIKFSYLNQNNDFSVYGYNDSSEKTLENTRYITIEKISSDKNQEKILVPEFYILIPYVSSHKLEMKFEGEHNLVYIESLSINNTNINAKVFSEKAKSNQKYRVGTSKTDKGIYLELLESNVIFDVSEVFNPIKLTPKEIEDFHEDYIFLRKIYLLFCTSITFLILLFSYKAVTNSLKIERKPKNHIIYNQQVIQHTHIVDNLKNTNKVTKIYFFITLIFSSILAINSSYFILLDNAFTLMTTSIDSINSNSQYETEVATRTSNILLFEQNLLPILMLIGLALSSISLFTNRIIKIIISLGVISVLFVLVADNCILNVLGTRLNLKFGGEYGGDAKYFTDFLVKYFLSASGLLMVFGLLATIVLVVFSFVKNNFKIPKNIYAGIFLLTVCTTAWGLSPRTFSIGDFKFSNVFQINGYCFQKIGNFMQNYESTYAPRDNLKIQWNTKQGLNKQQNVILLLVESLGCNFTYICGSGPSYMPHIEELAKENLLFDNYYSIIPSTSLSYLSIVKGFPVIQSMHDKPNEISKNFVFELYKQNDLIKHFRDNGYYTKFISSTDHVFGMKNTIELSTYDSIIDANDKVFSDIKERYVFNSVSDNVLFDYIVDSIKNKDNQSKFLYITKTASNHSPYNSPLAFNNIKKAFEYTDKAVNTFISKLKQINYFDNGIVVLVGDHHAWNDDGVIDTRHPVLINKVPLIIIDGKNESRVDHTEFSHASLGSILQYLELPEYKYNQYNINPFDNSENKSELIFGYDYQKFSLLAVKHKQKEAYVMLSGNDSEFLNKNIFTEEEQNEILGFIAWFRR
ncbi:MAG: LTA synthase family protein [Succinivibrionaceae bacterium]